MLPEFSRLIHRPTRDVADVLRALGYRLIEGSAERPAGWAPPTERAQRRRQRPSEGPFAALAELMPAGDRPPRRRRRRA